MPTQYEYVIHSKIASSLGLEVLPDANERFAALVSKSNSFSPNKWFSGPTVQFENCYKLGKYAEDFFLNYLFYIHNHFDSIEISVERLLRLCAEVGIPREIIDDYLKDMKNSFGVPKEKKAELETDAEAFGVFLRDGDPMLRGNITEIGDAEAVKHRRFVQ